MTDPIILTTYDWVPEGPRGHVRDVRIRWALDEAGLDYEVATTPFYDRGATHFQRQPFGQALFLRTTGSSCSKAARSCSIWAARAKN